MSYSTIARCARDQEFLARVTAAAAQEGAAQPELVIGELIWPVSSASDVEAAYASALAAGNPHPGGDEAVITDGMILSAVQAHMPP
jgi:hypothetical protein